MKTSANSRCRLLTISGSPEFDKSSKSVETLETAMSETVQRNNTNCWSAGDSKTNIHSIPLKSLCEQQNAKSALIVPLICSDNETTGAICAIDIATDRIEISRRLLEAAAMPLANSLAASQHRTGITQSWKPAISKLLRGRTGLLTLMTGVALTLIMFLQWPYPVTCECQIEPVMRRFVVATFKGTLETMLVEPGDFMHQGDVLARMDPRELHWKRASLIADQNQAIKRRDSAQASREYTTQQLSRLEAERLGLEVELLDHRINNLEMKSPVDGVVVSAGTHRLGDNSTFCNLSNRGKLDHLL